MNLSEIEDKIKNLLQITPSSEEAEEKLNQLSAALAKARRHLEKLERQYRILRRHFQGKPAEDRKGLSDLAEALRRHGAILKKKRDFREALEGLALRLLELVRAGRREEAFHLLLRVYIVHNTPMPRALAEAFSPRHAIEDFRLLIYSYLSGFSAYTQETQTT